jgi:hypothetical protein
MRAPGNKGPVERLGHRRLAAMRVSASHVDHAPRLEIEFAAEREDLPEPGFEFLQPTRFIGDRALRGSNDVSERTLSASLVVEPLIKATGAGL